MAQVRWPVGAEDDLEAAATYVSRVSPRYAATFVERVLSAVSVLEDFPRIGRVMPEFGIEAVRELVDRDHRIVDEVHAGTDTVRVISVHHGSRDLRRHIGDDPRDIT